MEYLVEYKLFEAVTTDFSKKPKLYIIYGEISEYEEKIKELSFILNDIDTDVETILGSIGGQARLSINITSRTNLGKSPGQMIPRGITWEKARKWIDGLALSEDYLEYIDRIRSIISDEYDIYTTEHTGTADTFAQNKLKYWDFNYIEIRKSITPLPSKKYGKMVPIEEAIDKFNEQNLGFMGKVKKWFRGSI